MGTTTDGGSDERAEHLTGDSDDAGDRVDGRVVNSALLCAARVLSA
jgi:hypothetical protein